ncbi:MAG: lasso peptide biosynthesis B2 protein [Sphingomonadaceae bacterium]|nr:lasso peptide biosynthesis B2 protein [Sphingomonadaceae bacterium]
MFRKAEAFLLLAIAYSLIRWVPMRHWRKWLGPLEPQSALAEDQHARAIAFGDLVERTATAAPFAAKCLACAMAARWMLARRGIATQLCFGARKGQDWRSHDLHAWLMAGDSCIIGAEERETYQTMGRP